MKTKSKFAKYICHLGNSPLIYDFVVVVVLGRQFLAKQIRGSFIYVAVYIHKWRKRPDPFFKPTTNLLSSAIHGEASDNDHWLYELSILIVINV